MFPKVDPKYKMRHMALGLMYTRLEDDPLHKTNLNKSKMKVSEIAEKLEISESDFKKLHFAFHSFEDDHVQCFGDSGFYEIGITEAGIIAYLDGYWIREGQKELNDRIYNMTRWVLPIIAVAISLLALIFSQLPKPTQQEKQTIIHKPQIR